MSNKLHNHDIYEIKAGDRLPNLEILLLDCKGVPLDLTPYEGNIKIVIASCVGGRRIVDEAFVTALAPLTEGRVVYEWQPGETDKPGEYLIEVILSPDLNVPQPKLMTLPGGGYGKMIITPRL